MSDPIPHPIPDSSAVYRDAAHLQSLLERVFASSYSGDEADLLTRHRMAVGFGFSDPALRVQIDGRSGPVQVSFDPASSLPAPDVSFLMSGETIHRFWMGELNIVAAMARGEVSARGNLIRALALTPMMPAMQATYRALWAEETPAG